MRIRQRGVAIVLAMGVVAMAAMVATAMMVTQSAWTRQNELMAHRVQAQTLLQVGVDWTRALLGDDRRVSNVDHLGEPWAMKLPPVPVENGTLAGQIEDHQGRFNLNNLVRDGKLNVDQAANFQRLLAVLALPPELADALGDWLDTDSEIRTPDGAEDDFYLGLQPPYLTANRPLIDVEELVLVRGFNTRTIERLRPFVSALPVFTAVNVNTASAEVLVAVMDGLDLDAARGVVERRQRGFFRDRHDFLSALPREVVVAPTDIDFSSNYFLVRMRVTIGSAQASSIALLARPDASWPGIVWRKMR